MRVRALHIKNLCVMCVRVRAKIVGLTMLNAKNNVVIWFLCYPRLVLSHLPELLGCKLVCGRGRVRASACAAHYHLEVQANPKKSVQKNRCYF